ncbi:hypothetical protein P4S73_07215 [Paraglaciecola sp. Hal342]
MFAKVEFSDDTTSWACFGGQGAQLEAVITQLFADVPAKDRQTLSNENGVVMALGFTTDALYAGSNRTRSSSVSRT